MLTFFSLLSSPLSHNNLENFLVAQLFRKAEAAEQSNRQGNGVFRLRKTQTGNIRSFLDKKLPSRCICCRRKKRHEQMNKARQEL